MCSDRSKCFNIKFSSQCDDLRPEDGDNGGFFDHGTDFGVDMAMLDIAGLFLLDAAKEDFAIWDKYNAKLFLKTLKLA